MKNFLRVAVLAICAVLMTTNANAQVITADRAQEIANSFFSSGMQKSAATRSVAAAELTTNFDSSILPEVSSSEAPTFHIITPASGKGFVIVAGEEMENPIIGYSMDGTIDANDLPVGFVDYMTDIDAQVKALRKYNAENPQKAAARSAMQKTNYAATTMDDIVQNLNTAPWAQSGPYSNLCTTTEGAQAKTGCGPTAFAILCYYYQWPTAGTGTVYHSGSGASMELGHTYDYANMLHSYSGSYTEAQATAVATLMRDLGWANNVTYGTSSTGFTETAQHLIDHFYFKSENPYNHGAGAANRDIVADDDAWKQHIKNCLDAGYPIPYSSTTSASGSARHIYILDGYTEGDYFHFNWGWGGDLNGWYTLETDGMKLSDGSNYSNSHRAYFYLIPNRASYTVTASASPTDAGTVSINGGTAASTATGDFFENATITLTATSTNEELYTFENWTKGGVEVSTAKSFSVNVTEAADYVANFLAVSATDQVNISITNNTGGIVRINGVETNTATVALNSEVTVTAEPSNGYIFSNWTDGGESIATTEYTFVAKSDKELTATFAVAPYYTITAEATTGGTATVNGSSTYSGQQNTTATLQATPDDGYYFISWTVNGSEVSTESTLEISIQGDKTYTANFANTEVTIKQSGSGGYMYIGTGTSVNTNTEVSTRSRTVNAGEKIYLRVEPVDKDFGYWRIGSSNGSIVTNDNPYFFTAKESTTFHLTCVETGTDLNVDVSATATAGGSATITIDDNAVTTAPLGEEVTLTATPNAGYRFVNWTINSTEISTEATCTAIVQEATTYTANFEVIEGGATTTQYTITASASPATAGTATTNGSSSATVNEGATVTLSATPNSGYEFVNWTNNLNTDVVTNNPYTVTATADVTYTAIFQETATTTYTITTAANPAEGGNVTGAGTYTEGATVTLTATANEGYTFTGWTSGTNTVSTDATYSFTANATANTDFVANFEEELPITDTKLEVTFSGATGFNDTNDVSQVQTATEPVITISSDGNNINCSTIDIAGVGVKHPYLRKNNSFTISVPEPYKILGYKLTVKGDNFNQGTVTYTTGTQMARSNTATAIIEGTTPKTIVETGLSTREINISLSDATAETAGVIVTNLEIDYTVEQAAATEYPTPTGTTNSSNYLTSVTTTGADANITYTANTHPGEKVVVIPGTVQIEKGQSFTMNFVANSLGEGSSSTVREDMRYCHASLFTDFDQDFTFQESPVQTWGNKPPTNNVYGNYDLVMNITHTITVPDDAPAGTSHVRMIYTNAWGDYPTNGTAKLDKGIVYDIVVEVVEKVEITATANPTEGGTITINGEATSTKRVIKGSSVTVNATPNSGYSFFNWSNSEGIVSETAEYTFPANSATALTANFEEEASTPTEDLSGRYFRVKQKDTSVYMNISDNTNNTGSTSGVTVASKTINKDAQIFYFIKSNDGYKLQARTGYYITCHDWNANATSNSDGTELTFESTDNELEYLIKWDNKNMNGTVERDDYFKVENSYIYCDAPSTAAATWVLEEVTLCTVTATASPVAGGTVTPETQTVEQGTSVTLTATPADGYDFVNWTLSGNDAGNTATITVTANADAEYIANFQAQVVTYTVTATANPVDGGTVTGGGTYNDGETATLTATPNANYSFVNWTKDDVEVSTDATFTTTVDADAEYVANFNYTGSYVAITTAVSTIGGGTGGTVNGSGNYAKDGTVTLTATPAGTNYRFMGWYNENDEQVSANATYEFKATANATYTAKFIKQVYVKIIQPQTTNETGIVYGYGYANTWIYDNITLTSTTVDYGTEVTIHVDVYAEFNNNVEFAYWSINDEKISQDENYTFTATEDRYDFLANFNLKATLAVEAGDNGSAFIGTVGTTSKTVVTGNTYTISAKANSGYAFDYWVKVVGTEETEVSRSAVYTFVLTATLNETVTYKAYFKEITELEDGKAYRIMARMYDGKYRYIYRDGTQIKWKDSSDGTNNSIFIAQYDFKANDGSLNLISAVGDCGWQYNGTLGNDYVALKTTGGTVEGTFTLYNEVSVGTGSSYRSYTAFSNTGTNTTGDAINFYTNASLQKVVDETTNGSTDFVFEEVPFEFNVGIADGKNAKLGTINLPFATTVHPSITAYHTTSCDGNWVYVEPLTLTGNILPANTPILVEAEEAGTYGFTPAEASNETYNTGFAGTLAAKEIDAETNAYILSYDGAGTDIKFYKLSSSDRTINANKAYYIDETGNASTLSFRFVGTTDVDEITDNRVQSTEIYDLTGRRVEEITAPGIYIVNGVKRIVR